MNLNEELDDLVNALDAFRAHGLSWSVKDYDQAIEINDPNDGSRVLYRFQLTSYGTSYWKVED